MRTALEIHAENRSLRNLASRLERNEGKAPDLSETRTWELWSTATWDKPDDRLYTIVTCTFAQAVAMVQSCVYVDYIATHKPHTALVIPSHDHAVSVIK